MNQNPWGMNPQNNQTEHWDEAEAERLAQQGADMVNPPAEPSQQGTSQTGRLDWDSFERAGFYIPPEVLGERGAAMVNDPNRGTR